MYMPDTVQARGGLQAGSQPQKWCDVCTHAFGDGEDRIELTLTREGKLLRVYAHEACGRRLRDLPAVRSFLRVRQPEPLTVSEKIAQLACEGRVAPGSAGGVDCDLG